MCVLTIFACQTAQAAPKCAKSARQALPGLIKRAMKLPGLVVLKEVPAKFLGWGAPAKRMLFEVSAQEFHFLYVIVRPGKSEQDLHPVNLLFGRMIKGEGRDSREMFTASLSGRMESAGIFYNSGVEKGKTVSESPEGNTEYEQLGPYTPRAMSLYERELIAMCRVASGLSLEEQGLRLKTPIPVKPK